MSTRPSKLHLGSADLDRPFLCRSVPVGESYFLTICRVSEPSGLIVYVPKALRFPCTAAWFSSGEPVSDCWRRIWVGRGAPNCMRNGHWERTSSSPTVFARKGLPSACHLLSHPTLRRVPTFRQAAAWRSPAPEESTAMGLSIGGKPLTQHEPSRWFLRRTADTKKSRRSGGEAFRNRGGLAACDRQQAHQQDQP